MLLLTGLVLSAAVLVWECQCLERERERERDECVYVYVSVRERGEKQGSKEGIEED